MISAEDFNHQVERRTPSVGVTQAPCPATAALSGSGVKVMCGLSNTDFHPAQQWGIDAMVMRRYLQIQRPCRKPQE